MNFKKRHAVTRWATAAVVAAGAITFVAADGYSYARRLFVRITATGSNCGGIYGRAIAYDVSGFQTACDVSVSSLVGNSNQGQTLCDPKQWGVPSYMRIQALPINSTTGDEGAQICSPTSLVPWNSHPTCSGVSPGGCSVVVDAWNN
jgi:hypothetical protein